jgi:aminopeptidase-like protein
MLLRSVSLGQQLAGAPSGQEIYNLAAEIYPICRSITGNGVRETLRRMQRFVDLRTYEVASGTAAFDWIVPQEWNIRDAYIKNAAGERVVDFRASNLHVMSYSTPVRGHFQLDELKSHIFTLPAQPSLIPYRTSYYKEDWGFCMAHASLQALPAGLYEVLIDSTLKDGSLTYGEYCHPGETGEEVLLSAHICHPSLANDNCSGLALLTYLAARLAGRRTRYTYRFVFAPGTIGAIVWLSQNEHLVSRIAHGLVVAGVGDGGGPTYKSSRRGNGAIDRAMAHVLHHTAPTARLLDFSPYGYDERQYCSPGFNLPVGLFQRSQFATFPEYHTSADDLDFISPEQLASSYRIILGALDILERDATMRNTAPKCEPQLGRRGLYPSTGGTSDGPQQAMAMLWVLNLSDSTHTLLDIAERSGLPFGTICEASRRLEENGLLVGGLLGSVG